MDANLSKAEPTNVGDEEDVCQTISNIKYNQYFKKTSTSGSLEKANPKSLDESVDK